MNLSLDSTTWWKTISGLIPGQNYTYQYLVDGTIKNSRPIQSINFRPKQ